MPLKIGLYIVTILLAGYEILLEGITNIFKLNFEEDTLMTIAVVAACILGEFTESCLVILLYKLGEIIEEEATKKSDESLQKIVDIKAKNANLIYNQDIQVVEVETLKVGDMILIKPGEMVPVDCKAISGTSHIDTSNITGESVPVLVKQNMQLLSGSINLDGKLECKVEKIFQDSTASQIVDLVYEAQNNKGKTEEFITKFSKIYTPIVIAIAVLISVIPVILGLELKTWITRALVFLVAACPCSLVISVPLALYNCLGSASRKGMFIKGTKHIEDLSKARMIAFDKTGTLTTGKMKVDKIEILEGNTEEVLNTIYSLERNSNHPIAKSVIQKIEEENGKEKIKCKDVENYQEIPGCGICGNIEEKFVLLGNKKLLNTYQVPNDNLEENKNYIAVDKKVVGSISVKEEVRADIEVLEKELQSLGIKKIAILTGDNRESAEKIGKELHIQEIYASLLPQEKLEKIEELKKQGKTIFVGDGINDSPVLASADFSISMGEGTEIASDTADSILISNDLKAISQSIKISKKTMKIMKTNITFSLLIKIIVLILGITGVAPIWLAVFADVGVTLLTVLNAMRIR